MKIGLGAIFAAYPYLNWWPLNSLISWVASLLEGQLWGSLATLINFEYVVFRNGATQAVFAQQQLALKQAALAPGGTGSQAYADARTAAQQAFAAHVRSLLVPNT